MKRDTRHERSCPSLFCVVFRGTRGPTHKTAEPFLVFLVAFHFEIAYFVQKPQLPAVFRFRPDLPSREQFEVHRCISPRREKTHEPLSLRPFLFQAEVSVKIPFQLRFSIRRVSGELHVYFQDVALSLGQTLGLVKEPDITALQQTRQGKVDQHGKKIFSTSPMICT